MGEIFRTRPDSPWGPTRLLYKGYRVITRLNRLGVVLTIHPQSSAKVKDRVALHFYSNSTASWPVCRMTFTFTFTYLLTPRCRVLPEQLTGLQLVKKFPRISRNPKVHYRTHKRPPPVPILGQPNPVHLPTSHLLEIRLNIIHPSTPRSPQWSLSLRFPYQDPIHPPLLTHTRHMGEERGCVPLTISYLLFYNGSSETRFSKIRYTV